MIDLRLSAPLALCACLIQWPAASEPAVSREEAESFRRKLEQIVANGNVPARPGQARHTVVTEREINAYLQHEGPEALPAGVSEPTIALPGEGRVEGRVVVQVTGNGEARSERGRADPLSFFSGKVPVSTLGRLRTGDGRGRFELESAGVSGIPVPPSLVQELLTYYSRGPDMPEGLRLDQEFLLPAGIQEVRLVGRGHALVVQ